MVCAQTVTNPVCQSCSNFAINQWLNEKGLDTFDLKANIETEDKCFKCLDNLAICLYCHTETVVEWVNSLNIEESLKKEFLTFFHFDLHHKGYLEKYPRDVL
jgi:hypothetical protein